MTTIVEVEGVGTVEFPDDMTPEQIQGALQQQFAQQAPSPVPPASPDAQASPSLASYLFPQLWGEGAMEAGKRRGDAFIENLPVMGATVGSMMVPQIGAARALSMLPLGGLPGILGRAGIRFGPSIAAAGAGGGVGGAAAEALRGGGVGDVARAGLDSAQEMAGAEAIGLGATTAAARVAAPALGHMTDIGRRALQFARETPLPSLGPVREGTALLGRQRRLPISPADVAPGRAQRGVQAVADFLLPSRIVTQSQRQKVVQRVLETPPNEANEVLRSLIRVDTRDLPLTRATESASSIARALGRGRAGQLGFEDVGPREFVARALTRGDAGMLGRRLGKAKLDAALTTNLENLIRNATRDANGRRVVDGEALLSAWQALPDAARKLYPKATREAVENYASFAAASARVPEAAAEGFLTFGPGAVSAGVGLAPAVAAGLGADAASTLGIGAGVAALTARSLMNPKGLLNKWLTNEKLPPEVLRTIGGQALKTGVRAEFSDEGQWGLLGP